MARDELRHAISHREVSRAGLWFAAPAQLQLPFEARGLSNVVVANGAFQLNPDYDVLAWLCARWLRKPTASGEMRPTLYEIGRDLYGGKPSGENYRDIEEALVRLASVAITLYGINGFTGEVGEHLMTHTSLLGVAKPRKSKGEDRFTIELSTPLRRGIEQDQALRLDWRILRRFHRSEQLAKRLWIYLAAERYKRTGYPKTKDAGHGLVEYEGAWLKEGDWLAASLGASYKQPADFRRKLRRACEVIQNTDDRWMAGTLRLEGRGKQARIYAERPTRTSWLQIKGHYEATRRDREQGRAQLRQQMRDAS